MISNLSDVIHALPPMRSGRELTEALTVLPAYSKEIKTADVATRLMALTDLYKLYIPSAMSTEIYSKLYLALLRSLQKKYNSRTRTLRPSCNRSTAESWVVLTALPLSVLLASGNLLQSVELFP